MEMDDESDPECDKANFPPICGNVFNRFEEFCQLLGVRNPTLCFRASIAKCSSIEISSACTQLKGKRTSKSSIWLFSKIIGLPVPASARDINGQHIQEAVSSAPNDPLFDTVWKLEDWKLKWLVGQREERHDVPKAMHHLLQLAISRGDVYYCFCRSAWQKGGASTHCWACHDCHTERFWSCGKCDKCVPSVHLRCPGCGGASDACERQWLGGKSYGFHGYMG
ncbi:hypothetical protein BDV95DRAFT_563464 [Massariosphaeria phaeospora]|uniref:Uncharacterized protein n=1 Tax=Massariosphaeria phaeospora TaxID=100035 RepID=A0A7C8MC19_9PLEO|nr:hypothetical protein BDV95DRAFT_563464 [Massariosphaeria phaeospora]